MPLKLDYPDILENFREYLDPKRSESAAFLIWYLEKYYRLDSLVAVNAVCDQRGDKGVDGVFVNDNDKTITIFQSAISQRTGRTVGDRVLREFAGTLAQFASADAVKHLVASAGTARIGKLAIELDLITKVGTHELRGEFLSNVELDANGEAFLKSSPNITFIGQKTLNATYISDDRDIPQHPLREFDVSGISVSEYIADASAKAIIAPIKATELVQLNGIGDQSLFVYNVRGPLGKTGVNKAIVTSITDPTTHKNFPLFHNGITVIAKTVDLSSDKIGVRDYFVVNGCQSLTALYNNKKSVTDNLRVLVKFIQTDPTSLLAKNITEFSNNQNGVKERDFMANSPMQIRLQNEFRKLYKDKYDFEIKRGDISWPGEVIPNEEAGLLLWAFDIGEPWATHRKYQVFDEKYAAIFGRPEVTADRIVMLRVIADEAIKTLPKIRNQLFAQYALTRYMLLFVIRNILEADKLWRTITNEPEKFVRDDKAREHFRASIRNIANDVAIDVDAEVNEFGETFDYRDSLRSEKWVKDMSRRLVTDHLKLVSRGKIKSFQAEWEAGN